MSDKLVYPELTPDLQGGFNFRMLKYFGAGAIMASVTIGSGETFFASRGGAIFGYALLWCFVGGAIMKGVQVYTSARYMTLTGEHPMAHWKYLPGPRGWVPTAFAIISIACFPFWLAGLPLFIGKTMNWMFEIDQAVANLPEIKALTGDAKEAAINNKLLFYGRLFGTACVVIAVTLTWFQTYGILERVQTIVVAILLLSMLAACFASNPDWLAALAGLVPNVPEYEPWIAEKYESISKTPEWIEVGVYLGAIGGGTYDYIGYIGCFREKKWGLIGQHVTADDQHETETIAQSAATLPIDTDDANIKRGRHWLWPAKIDVGVGFLCVLIFTICFVVLGAVILNPKQAVPEGNDLLTHQSQFLTQNFGDGFKYVYMVGIFAAFFGTIYGAYEIYLRTAYECLMPLSAKMRAMPQKKFRAVVLTYCAIGGLTMLWTLDNPGKIVGPAAIVGGVFACGLWCFAMIWADRKFLPKALRMGPILLTLNIISGAVLTVLGLQAIYDFVKGLFA